MRIDFFDCILSEIYIVSDFLRENVLIPHENTIINANGMNGKVAGWLEAKQKSYFDKFENKKPCCYYTLPPPDQCTRYFGEVDRTCAVCAGSVHDMCYVRPDNEKADVQKSPLRLPKSCCLSRRSVTTQIRTRTTSAACSFRAS